MLPRLMIPYTLTDEDQLCFVHIPKTAGTSLLTILDQQFSADETCEHRHAETILDLPQAELDKYRLIRAHGTFRQFEKVCKPSSIFITMLREPIDRVLSTYYYLTTSPENFYYNQVKAMGLKEFINWDSRDRWIIDNHQTRLITGTNLISQTPDLNEAKRIIRDRFKFVGLLERFTDSIQLLSYIFGWQFAEENRKVNITSTRPKKTELASQIIDDIKAINQLDIELYNYAAQLFEEQYKLMRLLKQSDQQYEDAASRIRAIFQA